MGLLCDCPRQSIDFDSLRGTPPLAVRPPVGHSYSSHPRCQPLAGLAGDESSPLHGVVPFNRTGCIRNVAGGKVAAPCLSLWERWPSAARTERVYAHGTNGRFHSKTLQDPLSLGYAEPALPEGEPRGGGWFRSTARVVFVTPRNGT